MNIASQATGTIRPATALCVFNALFRRKMAYKVAVNALFDIYCFCNNVLLIGKSKRMVPATFFLLSFVFVPPTIENQYLTNYRIL